MGTPVAAPLVATAAVLFAAGRTSLATAFFAVGALLLIGGIAGIHALLAHRYGRRGFVAFLLTQVGILTLPVLGLGLLALAVAMPLLAGALVRMRPPLRVAAALLLAPLPIAVAVAALSRLSILEAFAPLFPLPYAWLAVETLRLPVAPPK